ncbi:unnamed protein product [Microthlaspi erraticum]|uniref:Integrase catalytic domain-containing protein n=1 Tax=Microthlaspi erraticum TaxID=1685480 RepID=A0A6D2IIR3_9BRAS|nr:unnamed protein product [Microthlaspi erraticum]
MGKTHRSSFGPAQHVTKGKLDYIHSDLWGSPNVPISLGNSQYFISFIDDWSRKVWIYFLKSKDEAFDKFSEWKRMVELQSERKVKKLRTDNGLEFCNNRFDGLCKQAGIVRHKTCAYTPQQNGAAERLNRSIVNKVRSMLSESGLEQRFWAEAASTAVYLINRSPSSVIDFEIPEERWTSAAPDLSNLRVSVVFHMFTQMQKSSTQEPRKAYSSITLNESKDTEFGDNREPDSSTQGGADQREGGPSEPTQPEIGHEDQLVKPLRLEDYQIEDDEEDIAGYAYVVIEDGGKPEPGNFQEALRDPDSEK